jgi:hypothetical protein
VQRVGAVSWLFQTDPKSAKVGGKPYDLPTVDQAYNQQPDNGLRVNVRLDAPVNHTVPSLTAILDGLRVFGEDSRRRPATAVDSRISKNATPPASSLV